MKILYSIRDNPSSHTHTVLLDTGEEILPHNVLISMADGMPRRVAEECERLKKHPHFGGHVEIRKGRKTDRLYAKIIVYVD